MHENAPRDGALRRPLGLVLAGGGALGSWQAGVLERLEGSGLVFDKVWGFSAGSLSGAGYFLDRVDELVERWHDIEDQRILRLSPRLTPFSIFSQKSLWDSVQAAHDDRNARTVARCELTVVTRRSDDARFVYSRFTPGGEKGWDGPLAARLVASSAIPKVFPPLDIDGVRYVDGGIPGAEAHDLSALRGCADLLVVEMVGPSEIGLEFRHPWTKWDQIGRESLRSQMDAALAPVADWRPAPRVFRIFPEPRLDFSMLSFKNKFCRGALEQGRGNAAAFLASAAAV